MTLVLLSRQNVNSTRTLCIICRSLCLETSSVSKDSKAITGKSNMIGSVNAGLQLPPTDTKNDWVGPPHPVSNLRQTTFVELEGEGNAEREFREKRIRVQEWNQAFWEHHNIQFKKKKEEFINKVKIERASDLDCAKNAPISPEQMSVFYKKFLDDTYDVHTQYNKIWYRKNIGLLVPAVNAFLHRIVRKIFFKNKS